jgi:hypothetical protein
MLTPHAATADVSPEPSPAAPPDPTPPLGLGDLSRTASPRAQRRTLSGPLLLFALFGLFYTVPPQGSDRIFHLSGIIEAANAIREGQFPPRVAPHLADGRRYPVFQFYGNFPYGLAGALSLLPGVDAYDAWKVVVFLAVTCAGFYAYRTSLLLTRQVWPSVVAGVVFVTAPYLSTDFRARFAYTEAVSFCLLPAVLFYSLRAFASPRRRFILSAAVAWSLLALSHNITNLYGSTLLGLFALTLAGPGVRKFAARLARVAAAYVLGVALSAWYVFPQLKVLDCIDMAVSNAGASPLGTTAWAPLYALVSPVLTVAPEAKNSPYLGVQVGWPILAAALLALLHVGRSLLPAARRRARARGLRPPGPWMMARLLVALALAFFIVWSPVDFWRYLPRLFYNVQITYRILMFVVLWGSVLVGMALAAFWRGRPGGMPAGAAWACVLAAAVAAMPFQGWRLERLSSRTLRRLEASPTFGPAEYQYRTVPQRIAKYQLAVPPDAALLGVQDVSQRARVGRTTRLDLSLDRRSVVQLPVLFYPGLLDVRDNGRSTGCGHLDGLLALDLPPGRHELAVRFVGLRWANWGSGLSWLAVAGAGTAFAVTVLRRRATRTLPRAQSRPAVLGWSAAAFGAALLVVPLSLPAASAYWARKSAQRSAGIVLPSAEAFPGAKAINAFDDDPETEWVTPPGASAWLVLMPPEPRLVSAVELEPRQTELLAGWHRVTVVLYRGPRAVAAQTFDLPDAARRPLQVLTLERPAEADGIELRFAEPVTTTPDGDRQVRPESCYSGYREIRIR